MMVAPTAMPGWTVEVLGDDIAWLRIVDGRLRAINPENGFFGVAPGTGPASNPMALASCARDSIFTNVAIDPVTQDVWWAGIGGPHTLPPPRLVSWLRRDWSAAAPHTGSAEDTAHPNSRFTAPAVNCPSLAADWESPEGAPIDAIIFGGRRSETVPLVAQSRSWGGCCERAARAARAKARARPQRNATRRGAARLRARAHDSGRPSPSHVRSARRAAGRDALERADRRRRGCARRGAL